MTYNESVPANETNVRISPSGLEKLKCPRRWKFYYIDKIPDKAGPAAAIGTFVHTCYEDLYALEPKERHVESLRDIAATQWVEFIADYTESQLDGVALSDFDEAHLKSDIWEGMGNIWDMESPESVQIHSVEMKVEAEFDGIPFIGFVDRITETADANLVIGDYKFGKTPKVQYMADKMMQLLLYGWALDQMGIDTERCELLFIKGRMVIGAERNSKNKARVEKYLGKSVGTIQTCLEEDEFPPKPSPLCGWCPYITDCPEGEEFVMKLKQFGRMRRDAPALAALSERNRNKPDSEESIALLFKDL